MCICVIYICTHIYTYICIPTHTHTRTHTQSTSTSTHQHYPHPLTHHSSASTSPPPCDLAAHAAVGVEHPRVAVTREKREQQRGASPPMPPRPPPHFARCLPVSAARVGRWKGRTNSASSANVQRNLANSANSACVPHRRPLRRGSLLAGGRL